MTAAPAGAADRIGTLSSALAEACAGQAEERLVVAEGAAAAAAEVARLAGVAAPAGVALSWAGGCGDGVALGIGRARLVIASTGTAVIDLGTGEDQARATLLARHVVLVALEEDVLPDLETFWSAYLDLTASGALGPRQALVTGPSRTADIEKMLVMPAHGPAAVTLVIVGGARAWEEVAGAIYARIQEPPA